VRRELVREPGVRSRPILPVPARTVKQKKTKMPPTVAPGAQMGCAAAAVGQERSRDLGDGHAEQRCFDDHLAGKFHPGGSQPHSRVSRLSKTAISESPAIS